VRDLAPTIPVTYRRPGQISEMIASIPVACEAHQKGHEEVNGQNHCQQGIGSSLAGYGAFVYASQCYCDIQKWEKRAGPRIRNVILRPKSLPAHEYKSRTRELG
jgi:hypothetical protein